MKISLQLFSTKKEIWVWMYLWDKGSRKNKSLQTVGCRWWIVSNSSSVVEWFRVWLRCRRQKWHHHHQAKYQVNVFVLYLCIFFIPACLLISYLIENINISSLNTPSIKITDENMTIFMVGKSLMFTNKNIHEFCWTNLLTYCSIVIKITLCQRNFLSLTFITNKLTYCW